MKKILKKRRDGKYIEFEIWSQKDDQHKALESLNSYNNIRELRRDFTNEKIDTVKEEITKVIIVNDKMYSVESTHPIPLNVKTDDINFEFIQTPEFMKDWKGSSGHTFDITSAKYIKLELDIKQLLQNNLCYSTHKMSKQRVRKCEFVISSSGISKKHDARVYFAVFKNLATVYFLSISSQREHHRDDSDIRAVERADSQVKRISAAHNNQKPI
jgi:hypothetical protein